MPESTSLSQSLNVAGRLSIQAAAMPDAIAVVEPRGYDRQRRRQYRHVTFRQLDEDGDRIAAGLRQIGVTPGVRLALLVRPGIDFISLVFGLFKAGAVAILIDPGMGRRNLIRCLAEAEPQGFVAIPLVHAIRTLLRRRFPRAKFNVTVGRRLFWGGATLNGFRRQPHGPPAMAAANRDDPAAIIFTSGGTGPPKGVEYTHGNFAAQVDEIRDFYGIQVGEVDLPCFPLFGLFNCAMGATAVIPDMDPSRPALVDPAKIVEAVRDWNVTQAFGSPAIWNRVGRYCQKQGIRLNTLRRVMSAGAPVPIDVLERMQASIHPEGDVHTPYGATEALPVASISATEVLAQTAAETRRGAGVCVGRKFPQIQWQVIRALDGPIADIADASPLPAGEIGELIVRGPVVTRRYVTGEKKGTAPIFAKHPAGRSGKSDLSPFSSNSLAKIRDGDGFWHRMGDVGYFDQDGRFWFCGRMVHRVLTAEGPMYTVCCEAIFNQHPAIFRSALVGVGPLKQDSNSFLLRKRGAMATLVVGMLDNARAIGSMAKQAWPWHPTAILSATETNSGCQVPVIVLEPLPDRMPQSRADREALIGEARKLGKASPLTERIEHFLLHPALPVDVRHNVKIAREKLAVWAAGQLAAAGKLPPSS